MKRLIIYLEVDGIASDLNGNPAPAGMKIDLGEVCGEVFDKYSYDVLVKDFDAFGFLKQMGLIDAVNIHENDVRIVSPEYYISEYGDEDD